MENQNLSRSIGRKELESKMVSDRLEREITSLRSQLSKAQLENGTLRDEKAKTDKEAKVWGISALDESLWRIRRYIMCFRLLSLNYD